MEDTIKSSEEGEIIIFDELSMVRNRVEKIFQGIDIHVYGASNTIELFEILSNEELNIRLVIMDIGYDANTGFAILSKIKSNRNEIPIFILTSNSSRHIFIKGMAEGASDYILKPFEDDYLLKKVIPILNWKNPEKKMQKNIEKVENEIVFNILSYLATESKKAKKGNYELTILMLTFFIPVKEINEQIEKIYIEVSDLFYEKFKGALWDTDTLIKYGSQTFVGILPFCGSENKEKITNKLIDNFLEIKKDNETLSSIQFAITSTISSIESEDMKGLLLLLGEQMKKEIDEIKDSLVKFNQKE